MIALGTVARVVIAYATYGEAFDIDSYELVHTQLANDPFDVYGAVNSAVGDTELSRWPYAPGYFPWIEVSAALTGVGLPLHGTIQLPSIFADAGIALLVQYFLGLRGSSRQTRLLAAGAVVLGPSFAAISGYHGQIDSIAILPAVGALVVWESPSARSRALSAGLLIGAGAALKTVPILMVLALLPSARSRKEAGLLVGGAIAVPLLLILPFAVADLEGVRAAARYSGVPGLGGLSLAAQPSLAADWLELGMLVSLSEASKTLLDLGDVLTVASLVALAAYFARFRPPAHVAAVLLWLTVYAFSPNFFVQYLVWGLPFLLMAGYVRQTLAIQALVILPTILIYARPWDERTLVAVAYAAPMLALWVAWIVALVLLGRRMASRHPAPA